MNSTAGKINDLLYLMTRLRDANTGCPWDVQQTFSSIVPHTVEEVFEVVDAIEREDWPHLQEELGDLLFQVVFYSQLGKEQGLFDWSGVVQAIVDKLVRRHPHVFPDGTLDSQRLPGEPPDEAEIKANWARIKATEKAEKAKGKVAQHAPFAGVPLALPALQRALKIQQKAAEYGFDWTEIIAVIAKVREEVTELEQAIEQREGIDKLQEEMGDILFSCVNLCRFLNLDPETTTRKANSKFERRFMRMETIAKQAGRGLQDADLVEMEQYWEKAKQG